MLKSRAQRYYDVKTFLNKDKSSKSFVSYTIGRSVIKGIRIFWISFLMLSLVIMLFGQFVSLNDVILHGISCVHPFGKAKAQSDFVFSEYVLYQGVSPLFFVKEALPEEEEEPPPLPKVSITAQNGASRGIDIKNETSYTLDTISLLNEKIQLSTQNPKVLIVHTHGSESYTASQNYNYVPSGNYRTQDTDFNVIRVGEELTKHLRKKGIEVIHDKTINDYPSYNDSYNKTGKIIEKYLKEDSDICFVFDIHRDAVGEGENIVKFVSDVKGEKTAQVMIVCGTDVNLENPDWQENLKLAIHIQDKFERDYPSFLRPLNLRKERFNMHLSKGSLLFEMGTNGNTMDEALTAAKFLGEGLGDIINNIENY